MWGRKSNRYFKVFSSRWFGRGERKSICLTGQNSAVLHLICYCKFLRFLSFFSNFGNPAKKRYRRYPEIAISVNTFIVGFTVFFFVWLFVCFFFRVTPACALTFGVYIIYFLPKQMTLTGKIMQSRNGRRWEKFQHLVLLFKITLQNNLNLYNYSQNVLTWISGSI